MNCENEGTVFREPASRIRTWPCAEMWHSVTEHPVDARGKAPVESWRVPCGIVQDALHFGMESIDRRIYRPTDRPT
uniref:Uncharacterized protein n=1 Tax=Physcomitrium patens TaxID=3218 RepID=A0A2K1LBI4_PHYPA|nr:hypothetical protein PHYPA_001809 [Physcomitrium patens]